MSDWVDDTCEGADAYGDEREVRDAVIVVGPPNPGLSIGDLPKFV